MVISALTARATDRRANAAQHAPMTTCDATLTAAQNSLIAEVREERHAVASRRPSLTATYS